MWNWQKYYRYSYYIYIFLVHKFWTCWRQYIDGNELGCEWWSEMILLSTEDLVIILCLYTSMSPLGYTCTKIVLIPWHTIVHANNLMVAFLHISKFVYKEDTPSQIFYKYSMYDFIQKLELAQLIVILLYLFVYQQADDGPTGPCSGLEPSKSGRLPSRRLPPRDWATNQL